MSEGLRLPTSGEDSEDNVGEFATLVTALGGTSSTSNITEAPFYGVRGGLVYQDSNLFGFAGDSSHYWSSTPASSANAAYNLRFSGLSSVNPFINFGRQLGFSVRCIAR